jgi:hypothetical protein
MLTDIKNTLKEIDSLEKLSKKHGLIEVSEFGKLYNVSRVTIYSKIRRGEFPVIKISKTTFIITSLIKY